MTWWVVAAPFAILALVYAVVAVASREPNPYRLAEGYDGRTSTSKAQFLLWTAIVVPCYAALFTANWRTGHVDASLKMPDNLLAVLGISVATAVGAKALYAVGDAPKQKKAAPGAHGKGGLVTDDTGFPDLAKVQLVAWTLLAAGIFCIRVIHELRVTLGGTGHVAAMPDLDAALLTLMGISHAGYVGKKAVDRRKPAALATPRQRAEAGRGGA